MILLNPLKYFSEDVLEKLSPYCIISGIGFKATIIKEHDCDCKYCGIYEEKEDIFCKTKEEILDSYENVEKIEETFFVSIVKQNYENPLQII